MTTTVPLSTLHPHVGNVRFNATADDDLVASVCEQGVLTALTVAPHPAAAGEWVIIDGHRRYDAAQRADVAEVPVLVRDDLVTAAQQVEAMLVTALHRRGLTAVEEAAGYEQLALQGMDVADIARAVSTPQSSVKARLRLNALPDRARHRIHVGDLTLGEAEAMLGYVDDPVTLARLEDAAGSSEFAYELAAARSRADRAQVNAAAVEDLRSRGFHPAPADADVVPLEEFPTTALRDPAGHPDCIAYAVSDDPASFTPPHLVCTAPAVHPMRSPAPAPMSEWEQNRAQRTEEAAGRAAADAARRAWLGEHYRGLLPLRGHKHLATAAKVLVPVIGAETTPETGGDAMRALADVLATAAGDALAVDPLTQPADRLRHTLALWGWLHDAGYDLSAVDRQVRDDTAAALADLDEDTETA